MSSSEKWDKFVGGLKPKIQFKVRKANCQDFGEATTIAMRVKAAFCGVPVSSYTPASQSGEPFSLSNPMKIGKTQVQKTPSSKQRLGEIHNNACFYSHKVGCRPSNHKQNGGSNNFSVANIESALASEEQNDSVHSDSSGN